MSDNRYCYLHYKTIDKESASIDLPFEDIQVPLELLPVSLDEEQATLPSTVHPSYPYGNPFKETHSTIEQTSSIKTQVNSLYWDDLALDDLLPKNNQFKLDILSTEQQQEEEQDEDEEYEDNEDNNNGDHSSNSWSE
ncbi:hypothetical protein E3Q23_03205 [Wallemia mellicola]|nr:hypothetical protein E3Q23_03205 [Wallemia mellicola]TIC69189.1 hypothetical protein E3Q01_00482 [Wallemia mellicola]